MANRNCIGSSSRMPNSNSKDIHLRVRGEPFTLDRKVMISRSAKLAELLKENPQEDISHLLRDIPADPETFELIARFCYGFEVGLSTENVVRVCYLADYLGMTESHSSNNLLMKAITFFGQDVIPCWNKSVRALKTTEQIFQQALHLGLVDALADSIITKVVANPRLLGEPVKNLTSEDDDDEENENVYRPNARRRLFEFDWQQSEDLTSLSVQIYEPLIRAVVQKQVSSEYVAVSLCQYVKKWVFNSSVGEEDKSFSVMNSQREAIESVARLLPDEKGLFPCSLLFEMLRFAINLEACPECRNGLEVRIGKQLDQATVKDLVIPCLGYAKEEQYDTECVRRILKHFYLNYSSPETTSIIKVAELVEDFLAEVAGDRDLKKSTFISLADMAVAASVETQRSSDGIYRAISIYLDKHTYLTESEKEEVCRVLDLNKMSPEACEHAALNGRLPIRMVVQVLFVHQLQMKNIMAREVQSSDDGLMKSEEEITKGAGGSSEEEVRTEMEKMSCKVMELERECCMMRNEIEGGCCSRVAPKEKGGLWKEMKRKFGCMMTMQDSNCHVKKKKCIQDRDYGRVAFSSTNASFK